MSTMAIKPSNTRRQWGSRFDTLLSTDADKTPPVSPQKLRDGAASDPSQSRIHPLENSRANQGLHLKQTDNKLPHDASVFVGSLPPHIEEPELTRLLLDHLSEHAEVRNVKVIRDAKGGVCAFVQCETAGSAGRLINSLNNGPPRLFLGRHLRYEPARAFRSLWVSYRAPKQSISVVVGEDAQSNSRSEIKQIDLDLPTAMLIVRRSGLKHPTIIYNAEAQQFETASAVRQQDRYPILDTLYLSPVSFDEKTLESLLTVFGPIEYMEPVTAGGQLPPNSLTYTRAHGDLRSPDMDTRVWTVKFGHRDDCISALTTLRQVPHLTVTWAEQPAEPRYFTQRNISGLQASIQQFSVDPNQDASATPPDDARTMSDVTTLSQGVEPASITQVLVATADHHDAEQILSAAKERELSVPASQHRVADASRAYIDKDFPPLANTVPGTLSKSSFACRERSILKDGTSFSKLSPTLPTLKPYASVDEKDSSSSEAEVIEASVSENDDGLTATNSEVIIRKPLTIGIVPSLAISHSSPFPNGSTRVDDHGNGSDHFSQELDMPPTPELGKSPFTPLTPLFMKTPGDPPRALPDSPRIQSEDRNHATEVSESWSGDRVMLDPQSLFVGGLAYEGPNAWTEQSVFDHFDLKYGGVTDVKFVTPHIESKLAFAFVHFNNTEAPVRAIKEEANATYHGRHIRVQMRNHDPTRGAWRPSKALRAQGKDHVKPVRGREPTVGDDENTLVSSTQPLIQSSISIKSDDPFIERNNDAIQFASVNDSPVWMKQDETSNEEEVYNSSPARNETSGVSTREQSPAPSARSAPSTHLLGATDALEWAQAKHKSRSDGVYSSQASSTLVSAQYPVSNPANSYMPYQLPTMGVFPPHAWVHPMAHHYPYMPIMGYGGFAGFSAPARPSSPSGTDPSSPSNVPQWSTANVMFPPYLPYASYPQYNSATLQNTLQSAVHSPTPLLPTGFAHGEASSLIPMYQPQALGDYTSNSSGTQTQHLQSPTGRKSQVVPQSPIWPHGASGSGYPYNVYQQHATPLGSYPMQTLQSGRPGYPVALNGHTHHFAPAHVQSNVNTRHGYDGFKRHGGRREYHSNQRGSGNARASQHRQSDTLSHHSTATAATSFGSDVWGAWAMKGNQ